MEELDLEQISALLSELSQPAEVPKLTPKPKVPTAFDSDEVSFESSEWLVKVNYVAVWLNLDTTLDVQKDPEDVAAQLFGELVPDNAASCYEVSEGQVRLTEIGVDALTERLSRALSYKGDYLEWLDEGRSQSGATDAWIDAWNEAPPTEPLSINAKVEVYNINDFEGLADLDLLELNPTYQRDYVWPDSQSQKLIESVLRGIPLPSIILASESNSNKIQVVDGKQRITAILRFMGAHPEGRKHAQDMKNPDLLDTNFKRFARDNQLRATDCRRLCLPFKTKKSSRKGDPLERLGGRYYCDIKDEIVNIGGNDVSVARLFEKSTGYKIPVLIYNDTSVGDIHNVFQLYNKQGMKLNAEEIRNAAFNNLSITRLMLFVSGDRTEPEIVNEVDLSSIDIDTVHENIGALGFGLSRFRRTKVLFWILATLFLNPKQKQDGSYLTPSTASHIDRFLTDINDRRLKQFQDPATLVTLATDLGAAFELLQVCEAAWHEKFRNKKAVASKWEELPVIATMVACMVLVIMGKEQELYEGIERVRGKTRYLEGPESTQNKTQWEHIANSSITILEELGIDPSDASIALKDRFNSSAIDALVEIRRATMN